jgi:glycosyltransferase involved in cell wall biosynthesis
VGSLTGLKGHLEVAKAFEQSNFGDRPARLILNGNTPRPESKKRRWFERLQIKPRIERAVSIYKQRGMVRVAKWLIRGLLERLGLDWILVKLGYPPKVAVTAEETVVAVMRRINAIPGRRAMLVDLPRSELVQAYLNSDLFLFASKIEYSPLVLFESAAAGLPFLSAPVGNAAEIARWTGAGITCPATVDAQGYTQVDVKHLAAQLSSLSTQTEFLARLGVDGRRNWEQRFTWDRISRQYESIFEQCVESVEA